MVFILYKLDILYIDMNYKTVNTNTLRGWQYSLVCITDPDEVAKYASIIIDTNKSPYFVQKFNKTKQNIFKTNY